MCKMRSHPVSGGGCQSHSPSMHCVSSGDAAFSVRIGSGRFNQRMHSSISLAVENILSALARSTFIMFARKIQPKPRYVYNKLLSKERIERRSWANIDIPSISLFHIQEISVIPLIISVQRFDFEMKRGKFRFVEQQSRPKWNAICFTFDITRASVFATINRCLAMDCMMLEPFGISKKKCRHAFTVDLNCFN